MKGITSSFTVPEAAVQAVKAGSDLILVCHSPDQQAAVLEALIHAFEKGILSEAKLDASLARLLALKERFLLHPPSIRAPLIKQIVGCATHQALVKEIEKKSRAAIKKQGKQGI